MAKSGLEFKVRKWSETADRPFDVVALDHDKNRQHYQPGCEFITAESASEHQKVLTNMLINQPERILFIRDNWPIDGAVE